MGPDSESPRALTVVVADDQVVTVPASAGTVSALAIVGVRSSLNERPGTKPLAAGDTHSTVQRDLGVRAAAGADFTPAPSKYTRPWTAAGADENR